MFSFGVVIGIGIGFILGVLALGVAALTIGEP